MTTMRESSRKLAQGSIVWAKVADPKGNRKLRPVVIISESSEMVLDSPLVGVAVTTSFPDPPPIEYVELPWGHPRHPATQLGRRSAAVCRWLVELTPSQVEAVRGFVPTKTLLEIVRRVRKLNRPDESNDANSREEL